MVEVPWRDNETDVGSSFAFERVAVTTVVPLFSGISVTDVVKLTTGASSSLIFTSIEFSSDKTTFEILFPSLSVCIARPIEIVSIVSSNVSSTPVKTNDTDWDPAGTVIVSVTELV